MLDLLPAAVAAVGGAALGPVLDLAVTAVPRHAAEPAAAGAPAPTLVACGVECRRPLPRRRLTLTLLSAISFGVLGAASSGATWDLPVGLVLAAFLLPLAFCDLEHLLLPRRLVWGGTALVAVAIAAVYPAVGSEHRAVTAILCALVASCGTGVLWLANPRGLGFGDVRLALLIGLGLGWFGVGAVVISFFVASTGAAISGVALLLGRRASWGEGKALPFGVFLAAGAIFALATPALFGLSFPSPG